MVSTQSLVRGTLRALLEPKRLLAILFVAVPLIAAQGAYSREPLRAIPLGVAMCVLFLAIAPVSFRVLFAEGLPFRHVLLALCLYSAIGTGVVLSVGLVAPTALSLGPTFLTHTHSLAICIALFLVGGWGLGRDIGLESALEKARREAELAQLLALRSHLDPHFLFNTLNAIAEWCREDGEVAERAVLELSAMLRTILAAVHASSWPLREELALIRNLFALHLLRDPSRFTFAIEAPEELLDTPVPPMLLLPLAENAVKHGPGAGHLGEIVLRVERDEGSLRFTLHNPGPYKGPREGSSGVPTVQRRIQVAYGSAASLALRAASPSSTETLLQLPLIGVPS